jgi:hypothetical protein
MKGSAFRRDHLAAFEEGELCLLSKVDGMIRKLVPARPTSGAVKK